MRKVWKSLTSLLHNKVLVRTYEKKRYTYQALCGFVVFSNKIQQLLIIFIYPTLTFINHWPYHIYTKKRWINNFYTIFYHNFVRQQKLFCKHDKKMAFDFDGEFEVLPDFT